jgi:hypothetical protein
MIVSVKTPAATHDLHHKKNFINKVQNVNWMLHIDEVTSIEETVLQRL